MSKKKIIDWVLIIFLGLLLFYIGIKIFPNVDKFPILLISFGAAYLIYDKTPAGDKIYNIIT